MSTSQLYRFSSVNPLGVSGTVRSQSFWDSTGGAGQWPGRLHFDQPDLDAIGLLQSGSPSPIGEGIASVLTWTAPATKLYDFSGLFVSGVASTTSAAVAIEDSLGGTAPLSRTVLANNSVQSFSFSKAYDAGDVVQFQVGSNLSSGNVVGLQVSIVPEPSTFLLLGTGMFGLLASARRTRLQAASRRRHRRGRGGYRGRPVAARAGQ